MFCQSNNQDGYGLASTQQLPNAINNNMYTIRKKTCIFFPRCLHRNECKNETTITRVSSLAKNLSNLKIEKKKINDEINMYVEIVKSAHF